MAPRALLCALLALVLSLVPGADALDGGDAVALLIGVVIAVLGFCACLGWYARSRDGRL
ncbi:small integral membrane protein 30 [Scleropages formosus]|uniref:small integral membrane protein 30 n=1 Tax=Scleropages formosus TaxID=113540 RepID=UPI0010FA757A|nr:small integral membrane protein 30 [Scleropages formosus]